MPFNAAIGQSNFLILRRQGFDLIDKSQLITDLIQDSSLVILFPRPRRFGKTLNLSMLRCFLEKSEEAREDLFEDLRVWQDEAARPHFQRYPVISLSFKDVKLESWPQAFAKFQSLLVELCASFSYLASSPALSSFERASFEALYEKRAPDPAYYDVLADLSRWLTAHHGQKVWILIDEYDTPLYASYVHGYFDKMVSFVRSLLSGGLKDNSNLHKGVLTGILRVAKESIFSGLNNITVYSMLDSPFASAFGFTEEEVEGICERIGEPSLMAGMRQMYNGYLGALRSKRAISLYNPWSVLKCAMSPDHDLDPYWVNTSSDDILRELMLKKGMALNGPMSRLLAQEEIEEPLSDSVELRDLDKNEDALWSFLCYSGYLRANRVWHEQGRRWAALAIPNKEVRGVHQGLFRSWLQSGLSGKSELDAMLEALLSGADRGVEHYLSKLLLTNFSYHDVSRRSPEKLYHGLVMGLLVTLEGGYEVRSNPESGFGRVDVLVKPRQRGKAGVLMELKVLYPFENVKDALKGALDQIETRSYAAQLEAAGADPIYSYAALFDGKQAFVVTRESWQARFAGEGAKDSP